MADLGDQMANNEGRPDQTQLPTVPSSTRQYSLRDLFAPSTHYVNSYMGNAPPQSPPAAAHGAPRLVPTAQEYINAHNRPPANALLLTGIFALSDWQTQDDQTAQSGVEGLRTNSQSLTIASDSMTDAIAVWWRNPQSFGPGEGLSTAARNNLPSLYDISWARTAVNGDSYDMHMRITGERNVPTPDFGLMPDSSADPLIRLPPSFGPVGPRSRLDTTQGSERLSRRERCRQRRAEMDHLDPITGEWVRPHRGPLMTPYPTMFGYEGFPEPSRADPPSPPPAQIERFMILPATDPSHDRECPISQEDYDDSVHIAIRLRNVSCDHIFCRNYLTQASRVPGAGPTPMPELPQFSRRAALIPTLPQDMQDTPRSQGTWLSNPDPWAREQQEREMETRERYRHSMFATYGYGPDRITLHVPPTPSPVSFGSSGAGVIAGRDQRVRAHAATPVRDASEAPRASRTPLPLVPDLPSPGQPTAGRQQHVRYSGPRSRARQSMFANLASRPPTTSTTRPTLQQAVAQYRAAHDQVQQNRTNHMIQITLRMDELILQRFNMHAQRRLFGASPWEQEQVNELELQIEEERRDLLAQNENRLRGIREHVGEDRYARALSAQPTGYRMLDLMA
ncbi:hypothetical protein EK21DRAFT_94195 [Setomelanomma holmii]|uniref:Uncharacterized protein n=1 Tax=Setomelanomma holmii TaxID=210430 RepID=A0A9P4LH80_9PLEO|nr:hypothetical protein EK21DRAFT_94195 [Setomelanomma holmii]